MTDRSPKDESPPSETSAKRAEKLVGFVISGRYRVSDVLAVGGMGVVYRGQHVHMRKRVAIKLLLPETKGLPNLVARFEREAVVGAHITHPNIASATDFGQLDDGSYFLILEYARGITLSELIKQGPLEPLRAARVARQLAAALDAAHAMGVIHRDLKPRNVMIDVERGDFVKLIDFGLAKAPADGLATAENDDDDDDDGLMNQELTTVGVVFGTVAYMSPEAAFGMVMVDHRSDLYALGIILYEMLAGAHPFEVTDPIELFRLQRMVMPQPIGVRSPSVRVPPALESLVTRLLQKDPEGRFQSASEFLEALDEIMPEAAVAPPQERISSGAALTPPPSSARPKIKAPSSNPAPTSVRGIEIKPIPPSSEVSTTTTTTTSISSSTSGPASVRAHVPVVAVRARRESAGALVWTLRGLSIAILVAAVGIFWWRTRSGGPTVDGRPSATDAVPAAAPRELPAPPGPSVASAAPTTAVAGAGASISLQSRVRASADAKQWDAGADDLLELAKSDPAAFKDKDVAAAAAAITTGTSELGGDRAGKVFDVLSNSLGDAGLEILYSVAGEDGKEPISEPSKRALELLGSKAVLARESPAMRIAVEIRRAGCMKKAVLFNKAKRDGDKRTIAVLEVLRARTCSKKNGECCFTGNNLVDDTVRSIQERLKQSP